MTPCQNVVPLIIDDKGRMMSNTYCMKPKGHPEPCEDSKKTEKKKE